MGDPEQPSEGTPVGGSAAETAEMTPHLPRLAADVEIESPDSPGGPWILRYGAGKYCRAGAVMARLARLLDGRRDHAELAEILGPPWTTAHVAHAVGRLHRLGLLDEGQRRRSRPAPWIAFVPPLSIQLTLIRPERFFRRIRPITTVFARRVPALLMLTTGAGGLLALAAQTPELADILARPLSPDVLLAVLIGMLGTSLLHEFSHGAVLAHHGGRPSRIGVMLFYLTPAFYCDVTDGWRLPRARQRVGIALAGVAAQLIVAGAASIAALFVPSSGVRDGLLTFACVTAIGGGVNLLPFVKLDGYLALMSHLDRPFLRAHAISDARRWLSRLAFGGGYERELDWRWSVPFGICCMTLPVLLVAGAIGMWSDLLRGFGVVGVLVLLSVLCYIAYRLITGARAVLAEARRAGAGKVRVCAVVTGTVVVATAALTFVTVPYTVSGAYVTRAETSYLVLPSSADHEAIDRGDEVRLQTGGIALRRDTGRAAVEDPTATGMTAPASAFAPLDVDDSPAVPVTGFPVEVHTAPHSDTGMAQIDVGRVPLWEWVFRVTVAPLWR